MKFDMEHLDDELAVEISNLLKLQWDEIGRDFDLNINWSSYFNFENMGILRIFTVRKDKELIGYSSYIISPHMHHMEILVASQDSIFILPEHRAENIAGKFIDFLEDILKCEGVDHVTMAVKDKRDYSVLLTRRNYEPEETVYLKVLGG